MDRSVRLLLEGLCACRGCLGPLDPAAQAGLCSRCWSGLVPLPEGRCAACALLHDPDRGHPGPVAWVRGDAFWEYRGGWPPLGSLLVPAIKAGEEGWRRALLGRLARAPLPDLGPVDLVTHAPTRPWRRWMRGFDLAEEAAELLARRLGLPRARLLRKAWRAPCQEGRSEGERRSLPRKAVTCPWPRLAASRSILLVDDVWTTGTTLLRCARALRAAGAREVAVLALFRAS